MNAFATVPRYLLRPLAIWQNRHKIRLWRRISYTLIQQLSLQERFKVRFYGADFHPFPSSVSLGLWLFGEQLLEQDIQFLLELLRPGDTFVDIGANVGTHSICVGRHCGASTTVYSFEPHPRIYSYLTKNIALNKLHNIYPYNVALGETEGTVCLYNTVLDDRNHVSPPDEKGEVSVPLRTLDSFDCILKGLPTIKLDVEGYELFVLKGAPRTLEQVRFLYLEVGHGNSALFGYSAEDLLKFLEHTGWRLFRFEHPKRLVEIPPKYQPSEIENIVCARCYESDRTVGDLYYPGEVIRCYLGMGFSTY